MANGSSVKNYKASSELLPKKQRPGEFIHWLPFPIGQVALKGIIHSLTFPDLHTCVSLVAPTGIFSPSIKKSSGAKKEKSSCRSEVRYFVKIHHLVLGKQAGYMQKKLEHSLTHTQKYT